jgi:hypothetical protein
MVRTTSGVEYTIILCSHVDKSSEIACLGDRSWSWFVFACGEASSLQSTLSQELVYFEENVLMTTIPKIARKPVIEETAIEAFKFSKLCSSTMRVVRKLSYSIVFRAPARLLDAAELWSSSIFHSYLYNISPRSRRRSHHTPIQNFLSLTSPSLTICASHALLHSHCFIPNKMRTPPRLSLPLKRACISELWVDPRCVKRHAPRLDTSHLQAMSRIFRSLEQALGTRY